MSAPAAAAEAKTEGTPVEVQPQVTVTETVAADAQIAAINSNIRSLMNMVNGFALTLDRESRLRREAEEHNQEEILRLQNDFIMGRSPSSEGIAPPREELRNSRTVPNPRTSMLKHPQELMENTVIRVQKEVPEDLKVRVLSYKSVIFAEKNMLAWQSANQDPTKKIQDFLTPSVQLELVQNEQRLQRPMCEFLTLATLQDAQPATIIDMIARKLRPLTTENYYDTVAETVPLPLSKTRDWTFGFEGYDLELHASVSKVAEQARSLHHLITLNALDEDTQLWPKTCWGTKDRPGLIRVYLKTLGKYEVHFLERITEPALKAMESVTELFEAIIRVNHELCTMARTLTAKKAQFHKAPNLEEAFSAAKDRRTQSGFLAGKPFNQSATGTPLSHARPERDTRDRRPEHRENSNTGGNRPPYNRLRDMESEMRSPGETQPLAQVHPIDFGEDDEEEEYQSTLYEMIGTPAPRPPGQLFQGKVSPRPHPSSLPCFAHARNEEHSKDCPYSHDPLVYKEAMRRRVEDITATLGKAWLQTVMDKIDVRPTAQAGTSKGAPYQAATNRTPRYGDAPVRSVVANPRPTPPDLPGLEDESKYEGATVQDWKDDH